MPTLNRLCNIITQRFGGGGIAPCPPPLWIHPWSKGKCFTWDVAVPDTFATSHVNDISSKVGAVVDKASTSKTAKYANLCQSYIFMPIAVETSGVWNKQSYDFIVNLDRKISSITNDNRETSFLFQRLSIVIQRENEICFTKSFDSVIQNGTD